MIGIIGGGFGLYGWLPALCQYYPNETILLESRHKSKFDKRSELQKYKDRIEWKDGFDVVNDSKLLVIAIPPSKVYPYLEFIIDSKNCKKLIVEKPICETPEKSEAFIKAVEDKGIKICSSYLFLYTDWYRELDPDKQYEIVWFKINNNPKKSWKHNSKLGGGEIFYKIHLLALQSENINTTFVQLKKPRIFGYVPELIILDVKNRKFYYTDIFPESQKEEDNRIPYILQLLNDFENNYEKVNSLMHKTNELWKQEK